MTVADLPSAATILSLAQALGCGLLIGTERGWTDREQAPGTRVAGIRTFGLLGLCGGLSGLLHPMLGAVIAAGCVGLIIYGYVRQRATGPDASATTAVAALLAVATGAAAGGGQGTAALAAAAIVTLMLASRETLHSWLAGLDRVELLATARFCVVALVILPMLPNRDLGPYAAINPRALWLVVVLVSGLSFVGYLLAKRLGPARGLLVTAACGAIVSSTAVTVAFARRLGPEAPNRQLVGGIAIASGVMFGRVLVLVAVLAPAFTIPIAIAVVPALAVTAPFIVLALRAGSSVRGQALTLGNPFDLRPALLLAAMVGGLAIASRWLLDRSGDAGVGLLLAVTGVADVDAAVITFSRLPAGSLSPQSAAAVLVAPVLLNTAFKAVLALSFGARPFGIRAAFPLALAVIAGTAATALVVW